MTVTDIPSPDDPSQPDAPPQGPVLDEKAPAVAALRILQQLVVEARRDPQLKSYADLDLRVMNDVQVALAKNPKDPSAVQWLRQLGLSWNTKLRGNPALRFRRMFDLIESARR